MPSLVAPHALDTALRPRARVRGWSAGRLGVGAVASSALAAALGACLWLVLAAAERPSVLSPPTRRAPQQWLLGPLSGALPHLASSPRRLQTDLTVALVVLLVAWLVAWVTAPALPLRVVAGAVGLAQAVFLLGPPQPLTDTFNYIVYGRMALRGQNPYTVLPAATVHDRAWMLANWHHLPSPYGPLFTLLCEPLAALPDPAAFWLWKVLVVASALGTLALVAWLARRLGRSPQRAVAAAGLCPVVLAVGVGGLHNDGLALVCVLAAAALLVRGRAPETGGGGEALAAALAVVAAGLKPSFAVVVPLVVLGSRRRVPALAGAAWAGAAVVAIDLIAFGGALPAVGLQGRLATPLSLPTIAGWLTGHGGADATVRAVARGALVVVVAAACAAVAWRRRLTLPAMALVLAAAALSLSWVMPWYVGWFLPFAALASPRALVPLAIVVCLWFGVGGIPQMPKIVHAVGYYPTRSATGLANHNLEMGLVR
jgi:hypothetical protein